MRVLVVDVGGTRVKILATGQEASREFVFDPAMTVGEMVSKGPEGGQRSHNCAAHQCDDRK